MAVLMMVYRNWLLQNWDQLLICIIVDIYVIVCWIRVHATRHLPNLGFNDFRSWHDNSCRLIFNILSFSPHTIFHWKWDYPCYGCKLHFFLALISEKIDGPYNFFEFFAPAFFYSIYVLGPLTSNFHNSLIQSSECVQLYVLFKTRT